MEWIKPSDEPCPKDKHFIGKLKLYSNPVSLQYFEDIDRFGTFLGVVCFFEDDITHWMPLPKPPDV